MTDSTMAIKQSTEKKEPNPPENRLHQVALRLFLEVPPLSSLAITAVSEASPAEKKANVSVAQPLLNIPSLTLLNECPAAIRPILEAPWQARDLNLIDTKGIIFSPKVLDAQVIQPPFKGSPGDITGYARGLREITSDTSFINSKPQWLGLAGLLLHNPGSSQTAPFLRSTADRAGGALFASAGVYQGIRDFHHLQASQSLGGNVKYGTALLTDGSMTAGGVMSLGKVAKFGPKWLAPTLMLGGLTGRLVLDLLPDGKK